jgi:thermostable 8-oxoguanine DNA glycosylase
MRWLYSGDFFSFQPNKVRSASSDEIMFCLLLKHIKAEMAIEVAYQLDWNVERVMEDLHKEAEKSSPL